MRSRLGLMIAVAAAMIAVVVASASATASTVASGVVLWQDGWDTSGALDLAQSSVVWSEPTGSSLDTATT